MEWKEWLVTFVAGQLTGLATALLLAWADRRWRRQDVRTAEKRARLEERFDPLRRYASALCEFVHDIVGWMMIWDGKRYGDNWQGYADIMPQEIEKRAQKLVQVEPPPGAMIVLEGTEAYARLKKLEMLPIRSKESCLECLGTAREPDLEKFRAQADEADQHLEQILAYMTRMLDTVE